MDISVDRGNKYVTNMRLIRMKLNIRYYHQQPQGGQPYVSSSTFLPTGNAGLSTFSVTKLGLICPCHQTDEVWPRPLSTAPSNAETHPRSCRGATGIPLVVEDQQVVFYTGTDVRLTPVCPVLLQNFHHQLMQTAALGFCRSCPAGCFPGEN